MKHLNIKYCGNKSFQDLQIVSTSKADFIGVIFAKSKRQVHVNDLKEWLTTINLGSKKLVGVFVNEEISVIERIVKEIPLSIIQCHGTETKETLVEIKQKINLPIWKAIHHDNNAIQQMEQLVGFVDGYVIDSKVKGQWGGSGIAFDWGFIPSYVNEARKQGVPCLVAGGVNPLNVKELLKYEIDGIDISSGIEVDYCKNIERIEQIEEQVNQMIQIPDKNGRFGDFGGKFVPETLMNPLEEIENALEEALLDDDFINEYFAILREFSGRPTALTYAENVTSLLGGAKIYLKREDLNHTGAHKLNNAIGQALLAKRMGKKKIIAETGAGQHGVAAATVAARFGMECKVFMGEEDIERQRLNVFRMQLLGAEVIPATSGNKTLKDATNEAIRYWVQHCNDHFYMIGSVVGPHPYPKMVRDFQRVIGDEARKQFLERVGDLPTKIVACVGGGSNAIGMFYPFLQDDVELIGVEAAGKGIDTPLHAATITKGTKGVIHGSLTYLLQDKHGQIMEPYSISAGLDYPGVGPEHAYLSSIGRVKYESVTDDEALGALQLLARQEGIIPAIESAHALAKAFEIAQNMTNDQTMLICLSGRGDKDVHSLMEHLKGVEESESNKQFAHSN